MERYISIQVVTSIIKLVKIDKPSCTWSIEIIDVLDTTNMPFDIHVTYNTKQFKHSRHVISHPRHLKH